MTATTTIGLPAIEVDGSPLGAELVQFLERVEVLDRLALPDTFTLVFRDPFRDIVKASALAIGKGLKIQVEIGGAKKPLIDAEITALEADYTRDGATRAVIRGYDRSHRLATGGRSRAFVNMTYGDIVKQIAEEAGLTPELDDPGTMVEHLLQANQSDLDFLADLTRRSGYDCRVDGQKLLFKKPTQAADGPDPGDYEEASGLQLVWGRNLREFRARMSAVGQVEKVEVRGWDPKEKAPVTAEAPTTADHVGLTTTPKKLAGAVGGVLGIVTGQTVPDEPTAKTLAGGRARQIGSAGFEATAVIIGDPEAKAGVPVNIAGVDEQLAGKWTVSSSRHTFDLVDGYLTTLDFHGGSDRSLAGTIAGGGGTQREPRIGGVVVGLVRDVEDPAGLGRVQVVLPWLDSELKSTWARLSMLGAGPEYGAYWVPQVDDEVLVAFEFGDVNRPVILGGLWNGKDKPPVTFEFDSGKVKQVGFRSRAGHSIALHDGSDLLAIRIATADDKFSIVLDQTNGELAVSASGKLTIETAQGGDIAVKAAGNLTLEASGNVTLKGAQVAIN